MISGNQGKDLQLLERLRADPCLPLIRTALQAMSTRMSKYDVKPPVYYTINKLLWLIDGH